MPSLQMLPVALRRLLARRPWIHWLVVLTAAVATGAAAAGTRRTRSTTRGRLGVTRGEVLVAGGRHGTR